MSIAPVSWERSYPRLTHALFQPLSFGSLKKTPAGYTFSVAHYNPTSLQTFTWVERALGPSVLALFKNYSDPTKNIVGKSFPVVTAILTYPELIDKISAGEYAFLPRGAC